MADETITSPRAPATTEQPKGPFWDFGSESNEPGQAAAVEFNPARLTDWYRVILGGTELPGVCSVRSAGRQRRVDVANAPADEQSTLIDTGSTAAEVVITVTMWTTSHHARWERFAEVARDWFKAAEAVNQANAAAGSEKKKPPAMDVQHPGLALAGITSLYLRQVSVLEPGPVPGSMAATISAVEYDHRPKPKAKQAAGPVDNSLDGIAKMKTAKELQPKATPSTTQVGP
jgi:hypothetical protein